MSYQAERVRAADEADRAKLRICMCEHPGTAHADEDGHVGVGHCLHRRCKCERFKLRQAGGVMEPVMTMMSGTCVHVLAPNLGPAPTLHEIAWALAHINRFNGHLIKPVSVAKHSIALSLLVTQEHRVRALLHDASEAVLGDVVKPLKMTENFGPYRLIEKLWQLRIYDELGGLAAHSDDDVDPPEMVRLDMALVRLEARFMGTDSLWRGVRSLTEHWDIDLDEDQTTVVEEFYIRNDYKAASDIAAWWEDLVQWNMEREAR